MLLCLIVDLALWTRDGHCPPSGRSQLLPLDSPATRGVALKLPGRRAGFSGATPGHKGASPALGAQAPALRKIEID
jgi:hypothetical protein